LKELVELKKNMAVSSSESAQTSIVVAQAELAVAQAESVKVESSAKKYLLIGGIALVLLVGGIIAYKKLKK
jgi:ABC-type nickel/cobalt efflux system permease component RcnA